MGGMSTVQHLTAEQLDAGVASFLDSPDDLGTVEMIVRRPAVDEREVLDQCELKAGQGLVGDSYPQRPGSATDSSPHPEAQLNLMNSSAIDLVAAGERDRWPLAGDQFFVDLDLSVDNLPIGTRLTLGTAVIEVAAKPHNGCAKFAARYGQEAVRWVNRDKQQRRRGLNAMVIESGVVRTGDAIAKL